MIIDGMAAMADYCPLTTEALHEQAAAQTGLTDFGDQDYRERMAVLLKAFNELPRITPFGRTYAFSLMLTFLKGRLRVIDHLKKHPEIFDIDVAAPPGRRRASHPTTTPALWQGIDSLRRRPTHRGPL